MARVLVTWEEQGLTPLKRTALTASAAAVLLLTLALMGWMLAQVAEHPGVAREVSELPSWFTGAPAMPGAREPSTAQAAAGEAAPAHGHEAGTAVASIKSAAPEKTAAAEGEYVDVAGGKVEIAYKEYQLTPNKIRVGPGKVTFVLRNEGRYSHDFRINVEGPGIDITTQKFGPGRTIRLEVALQEGEYKISCPLSNHDERGMHGTLIVTSKLAGK